MTNTCNSVGVSLLCFFFSSRRRHTRCLSDWSSDVCSSDLDDLHFIIVIKEISSAWPDDHLQTDAQVLPDQANAPEAGRGAPLQKIVAEFHPVRAAAFGSDRAGH